MREVRQGAYFYVSQGIWKAM